MAFTRFEQFWPIVYDLLEYVIEFLARVKKNCKWKTQKEGCFTSEQLVRKNRRLFSIPSKTRLSQTVKLVLLALKGIYESYFLLFGLR